MIGTVSCYLYRLSTLLKVYKAWNSLLDKIIFTLFHMQQNCSRQLLKHIVKQKGHEALHRSPENGLIKIHQDQLSDKIPNCSSQKCDLYSVN